MLNYSMHWADSINAEPSNSTSNFPCASISNTEQTIPNRCMNKFIKKQRRTKPIHNSHNKQVDHVLVRVCESGPLEARIRPTCNHSSGYFRLSLKIHSHPVRTYRRQVGFLDFSPPNQTHLIRQCVPIIRLKGL